MPGPIPRLISALAFVVVVSGSAAHATQEPAEPVPAAVPSPEWIAQLKEDAVSRGISQRTVDAALTGIALLPVVTERDRTQPERTLTIDQYLKRRVDSKTVKTSREMAARNAALLARVSTDYGVPRGIIVSIWGLESNFGRFSGVRPTIQALVTLAYDNRRAAMFRQELFAALEILDKGDIDLAAMKGSWAGAMGQPQFMPSSYLKYAEDFDRDGARDIWGSTTDVFASIANYLKQNGWTTGARWGLLVSLPAGKADRIQDAAPRRGEGCEAVRQMTGSLTLARWRELGVRAVGRQAWPAPATAASLVRAGNRAFLVLDNYSVLLQYNCAHAYALAVGLLADQIR
jgi:membrane-bound lytic murein transglycosylase B